MGLREQKQIPDLKKQRVNNEVVPFMRVVGGGREKEVILTSLLFILLQDWNIIFLL